VHRPSGTTHRPGAADPGLQLRIEGEGAPLVYVPGIDGTGALFYTQSPRLGARFRVATYRLRDDAAHMEALVDDLGHVVDAVAAATEPVTLVAESFGGALAMSFALRHATRVRALVVLNSFARYRAPWQLHVAAAGVQLLPWGLTHGLRNLSAARLHSRSTPRPEVRRALQLTRSSTRDGYRNRLRMLTRYDLRERLAELQVPTLFVAADCDTLIPSVEQARFMASRVPHAQLRILEGHGHACLLAPDVDVGALMRETWGM
jgi:pimeloyl-ACP methyl ester carboxylesterase